MPEKLERCVDDVKGQKGVDSAYAICNASLKESHSPLDIIEADGNVCDKCGKPEDEHGMFTDHKFEKERDLDEVEEALKKPYPPFNNSPGMNEAVSIGGGLSAVSIGGKRHKDQLKETECLPCQRFDKVHDALTRGY